MLVPTSQTSSPVTSSRQPWEVAAGDNQDISDDQMGGQPIPSMQSLRQCRDLQHRLQQRFRELDQLQQDGDSGNLDLLLQMLSKSKTEKTKVKWPQDLAFIGSARKRPSYDQLSMAQWMLGFLRIQQEDQNHVIKENMSLYLVKLLQDTCDFGWDSAKGAHSVLLHLMQDGVLDWTNLKEIKKIRKRFAQTNPQPNHSDRARSTKQVSCNSFNKGTCNRQGDHEWQNMLLRYVCSYCLSQNNQAFPHARKDCYKAPKEHAKNFNQKSPLANKIGICKNYTQIILLFMKIYNIHIHHFVSFVKSIKLKCVFQF